MRDLHCIRAGGVYFHGIKAWLDDSPSPDTPSSSQDKPELRQQLKDPKRVFAWGLSFAFAAHQSAFNPA
jgi:hypothetical protein